MTSGPKKVHEEDGVDFRQFSMSANEYAAAQVLDSLELTEHNTDQLTFDFQL